MKNVLVFTLASFSLVFLLLMERVMGLPLLSVTLFFVMMASYTNTMHIWAGIGAGIVLSVVYVLSLWLGVILVGAGMFFYIYGGKFIKSDRRRLLLAVVVFNVILTLLIGLPMSTGSITYHFVVMMIIAVVLYGSIGWRSRAPLLGLSKRLRQT